VHSPTYIGVDETGNASYNSQLFLSDEAIEVNSHGNRKFKWMEYPTFGWGMLNNFKCISV